MNQSALEKMVGNFIAGILILIVIFSFIYTLYGFFFTDGRGLFLAGTRGEFYLSE